MMIDILLATHNGELYLQDLFDSLVNQRFPNWSVWVRDDMSSDRTLDIISRNQDILGMQRIRYSSNTSRLGSSQTFGLLLQNTNSKYIMFCDQDDVWLSQKIELTLSKMLDAEREYGKNTPILIHSDLKVVDQNLSDISDSLWRYQKLDIHSGCNLSRLLVQNIVTGCTMMINQPLRRLIKSIPSEAIMHDWWIALVATVFGKIEYVSCPTIMYRQHSHNNTGAKQRDFSYYYNRLLNSNNIRDYYNKTITQARSFLEIYDGRLDPKAFQIIYNYAYMEQKNFFLKRLDLLKYGYYKVGSFNNFGLFLVV